MGGRRIRERVFPQSSCNFCPEHESSSSSSSNSSNGSSNGNSQVAWQLFFVHEEPRPHQQHWDGGNVFFARGKNVSFLGWGKSRHGTLGSIFLGPLSPFALLPLPKNASWKKGVLKKAFCRAQMQKSGDKFL